MIMKISNIGFAIAIFHRLYYEEVKLGREICGYFLIEIASRYQPVLIERFKIYFSKSDR